MQEHKCDSNCFWGVIMVTVGFFFVVAGFIAQTSSASFWNWWALLYYLIGFFLWVHGKVCHEGGCDMPAHSTKKKRR